MRSNSFVAYAQEYSRPLGFVSDFAGVIPDDTESNIEAIAQEVERKTTAEIAVVTVPTAGGMDIHDYSVELFTKWGIGKTGKDNGILIIAAINDRKLWIKTGYGLEHVIPDAVASDIYRGVLRPSFRAGDYGGGLLAAVLIVARRIAESEGVTLASADSVVAAQPVVVTDEGTRMVLFGFFVFVALLVIITLIQARAIVSGKRTGFPFWTIGGFAGGGGGGSFGGGFGGFGGGSCGGGGAGGGW
ncbi:MAG: TPM domain-containing protein [Candidatus Eiseniibacteriota bacterium]|nr:MAG: TPM domain-containing protein [Candidatus Eisenbacteria bacterium]